MVRKMSKNSKELKLIDLFSFFIGKPLILDLDMKLVFSGIEIGTLKVKGTIRIGEEAK